MFQMFFHFVHLCVDFVILEPDIRLEKKLLAAEFTLIIVDLVVKQILLLLPFCMPEGLNKKQD